MDISFCTAPGSLNLNVGFGIAGYGIVTSLQKLGYNVPYCNRKSPILINFCQPVYAEEPSPNREDIIMVPWESTILPEGWVDTINEYDHRWTTSELCREIFIDNGVREPVEVYHHGVDESFTIKKRKSKDKVRFLINGGESPRKNAQLAFDSFRAAFGDQDDVQLTIKCNGQSLVRSVENGEFKGVANRYKNVIVDTRSLPRENMVNYYYQHDVMLCPAASEGFGLPGLEAISSGMPTIVTKWWCPYSDYAITLDYKIINSPWPLMHPGKVAQPDFDQLVFLMQNTYNNYDALARKAVVNAYKVRKEFNWINLTREAFSDVIKIAENKSLN